jgi:REP element-mobilizing transposase RayT
MRGKPIPGRWHKKIRLARHLYAQSGAICSVTIAVRRRRPGFSDPGVAPAAVEILRERAAQASVPISGYCVMPDHGHLVPGAGPQCDIPTFVGQFKNLAQRAAWQHGVVGRCWQTSFGDHFLRAEEELDQVVA